MPDSARRLIRLGACIGIIAITCCAVAVAMGCFTRRAPPPAEQPIVEEMPPAGPTISALPQRCAELPVLAGTISEKNAQADDKDGARGQIPVWVQASSFISTARGLSSLFDSAPESYWHIDVAKRLQIEWATFDLGKDTAVAALEVRPRLDQPSQLFAAACLLGSSDHESWKGIAQLTVAPALTPRWIGWRFTVPQSFHYFQIVIPNDDHKFYSIGKLHFLPSGDSRS